MGNIDNIINYILIASAAVVSVNFIYRIIAAYAKHDHKNLEKEDFILSSFYGVLGGILNMIGIGAHDTSHTLMEEEFKDHQIIKNTLTLGYTLPIILSAIIYANTFKIDSETMWYLIAAAAVGIILGSFMGNIEFKLRKMAAFLLLFAGAILLFQKFYYLPNSRNILALKSTGLIAGILCNFFFGIMIANSITLVAPSLAIYLTLGITPRTALTMALVGLAFMLSVISAKILREGNYLLLTAIAITLTGLAGTFLGFTIYDNMTVNMVKWTYITAMVYGGVSNLMRVIKREYEDSDA